MQGLDYLDDKIEITDLHSVLGHHVMVIQLSWEHEMDEANAQFEALVGLYEMSYQVVIVIPASVSSIRNPVSFADRWPEALSLKSSIIVVGAVDVKTGLTFPWSKGQYQVVNAPGGVRCARNKPGDAAVYLEGNYVAAMQAGALAGYFLSLPDTGPFLREYELGIPETVNEYIIDSARIPMRGDRRSHS